MHSPPPSTSSHISIHSFLQLQWKKHNSILNPPSESFMTLGEPFEHQFYHLKREKCEPTSKVWAGMGRSPTKGTMKRLTQGMGAQYRS